MSCDFLQPVITNKQLKHKNLDCFITYLVCEKVFYLSNQEPLEPLLFFFCLIWSLKTCFSCLIWSHQNLCSFIPLFWSPKKLYCFISYLELKAPLLLVLYWSPMNLLSLIWSPKENCLSLLSGAQEMLKSVLFLSGALRTSVWTYIG